MKLAFSSLETFFFLRIIFIKKNKKIFSRFWQIHYKNTDCDSFCFLLLVNIHDIPRSGLSKTETVRKPESSILHFLQSWHQMHSTEYVWFFYLCFLDWPLCIHFTIKIHKLTGLRLTKIRIRFILFQRTSLKY